MTGIIEEVLFERYGRQIVSLTADFSMSTWNADTEAKRCIIYKPRDVGEVQDPPFPQLRELYGDALGASILGDSIIVAMLSGPEVFGLYHFHELQQQPEVLSALQQKRDICYFMECANVWFYGVRNRDLYVYDSETGELDCLGPIRREFALLIQQWEEAKPVR
jgi:hypothetical protein